MEIRLILIVLGLLLVICVIALALGIRKDYCRMCKRDTFHWVMDRSRYDKIEGSYEITVKRHCRRCGNTKAGKFWFPKRKVGRMADY
jgi:hypothetical protein